MLVPGSEAPNPRQTLTQQNYSIKPSLCPPSGCLPRARRTKAQHLPISPTASNNLFSKKFLYWEQLARPFQPPFRSLSPKSFRDGSQPALPDPCSFF